MALGDRSYYEVLKQLGGKQLSEMIGGEPNKEAYTISLLQWIKQHNKRAKQYEKDNRTTSSNYENDY
jgi:hypothetical protein